MTTTPDFGLPQLAQSQANPDVTHNEAIQLLQALLNGAIDRAVNAPPGSPSNGDVYILGAAPTGAWAGQANKVAVRVGDAWRFVPNGVAIGARHEGIRLWVRDEDAVYVWSGSAWVQNSPPSAAAVSNTPAGNIAATNVQDALNELDSEKVAKAGDTMTGALMISTPSGSPTPLSLTVTDNIVQVITNRDDTTPGNNIIASYVAQGDDSDGNVTNYGNIRYSILDNVDGSEDGTIEFRTVQNGAIGTRLQVTNGAFMASAGGDQGAGSFNAQTIYTQARLSIDNDSVFRARVFTVATLPAPAAGKRAHVSDANDTTFASIVAGGGANSVPVYADAANWRIG